MCSSCKSFFYLFDLIGPNPKLVIFKEERYKSIFSSILSIIIILVSIAFSIMPLIEYFKYDNPVIVYSKDNDSETKRIIYLNDTLLMFQLVNFTTNNINNSIAYYKGYWNIILDNGTTNTILLGIEECKLDKNIDSKFSDLINDYYTYGRDIKDFYCINMKDRDLPLFYIPHYGYSYITLFTIFKNNNHYSPEEIQNLIVNESDFIIHNNKHNPIERQFDYHFTESYNSFEYTRIDYNLQFIKYESDDGFLYKNSKIFQGISFSDMTNFRTIQDYDFNESNEKEIGKITISINKSNFDNYKRTYPRIQSLLADVMSVVNLLFEIVRIVILFLSEKNMSKDIIKYILYGDNENIKININNKVFKNQIAITESGMNIRNEKEEKEKESISNNSNEKNNTMGTNNINTDNKDEFGKKKQNKINNLFKTNYFVI